MKPRFSKSDARFDSFLFLFLIVVVLCFSSFLSLSLPIYFVLSTFPSTPIFKKSLLNCSVAFKPNVHNITIKTHLTSSHGRRTGTDTKHTTERTYDVRRTSKRQRERRELLNCTFDIVIVFTTSLDSVRNRISYSILQNGKSASSIFRRYVCLCLLSAWFGLTPSGMERLRSIQFCCAMLCFV